jgi:hypothetical protein
MPELVTLTRVATIVLFAGFAILVFTRLLNGGISLSGLLAGDREGTFSAGRAQLLFFTSSGAIGYLVQVLHDPAASSLPHPPAALVTLIGGSQLVYLVGKAWAVLGDGVFRNRRS